jgi:hypothetical protein
LADPSAISGNAMGFASSSAVVLWAMAAFAGTNASRKNAATSARRIDKYLLQIGPNDLMRKRSR